MSFDQSSKSSKSSFGEPQEDGDSSFGTNNYEAKLAASEKAAESAFGVDEVADLGIMFRDFVVREVPKAAVNALKVVRSTLTPGFVRRMKKTKIHIKHVADAEKALDDLNVASAQNMVKELEHKKAEKEQDKMIREMLKARKHLRDEVKAVVDESNAKERDAEFQDFHRRHDLRLAEINAKIAREKKEAAEAAEKEAADKRIWRINYYGEQARQLKAESEERAITLAKEKQYQATLERTFTEFENRQFDRTVLQVGGIADGDDRMPLPGGNELGIFGISSSNPTGIKVNHNNNNRLDGDAAVEGEDEEMFLEDVDQFDNHPTEYAAYAPYEEANIEVIDAETQLKQQQELYAALQAEISELKMSIEQMYDVRQVLERDQTQLTQELLVIEKDQHGPPRRMAMMQEIQATDVWKRRTAQVNKRILDLQYSIDKAESRKNAADSQSLTLAQTIAVLTQELKQKQAAADSFNGEMGQLPMIVGRSLNKVPGMDVTAKPKEFYDAVTHQSRLVGIRDQSLTAAQIHRERTGIDQDIWMERLKEEDVKQELDNVVSRLVVIADRLKKSNVETMRLNIIDSLKGFLASGLKLNPVRTKLVGLLPWYKHHDAKLSHHIKRYITNNAMGGLSFEIESDKPKQTADIDPSKEAFSNGVTLSDARSGYCVGTVELPKDTLWSVLVTISSQSIAKKKPSMFNPPLNADGTPELASDPTDFVSVKMGPTIASMSNQGTFFNKINPLTGTILYDVRYVFRGKGFAFRFDFSSSSLKSEDHLAVCTGIFEEYEMKDLEVVNDPKTASRQRVLSSFVKMLRINEQSGVMREVKLLEELIIIESNTKAKTWDSDIVSHVLQRYSKEYFLRILRAEILLQQEAGRVAWLQRQKEKEASRGLMAGGDIEKELKLEASMKKYLMKKRAVQRRILDEGKDKVGKRIVLWDPSANLWRNLTILECKVKWVENGMVAHVTHMFQEYDEGHNKAGDPMELDLKNFKYFESPVQVIDAQSIARYKEKKAWDDSIRAIKERAKGQVAKLQEKFNKDSKREERIFRRMQRKAIAKFESSIDVNAQKKINSREAKEDLKKGFERALLDIRKGIITVDDLATAKEKKFIATQVSRERFLEKYKREKKEKFDDDMADKEEEMRDNIEELRQDFEIRRDNVNMQAEHEIEQIRKKIRAQLAKRKVHLLKKLKFEPEVFKKAVPQAANCEHLKTKAWGNNYGKGVKCMNCGKELEELYKEESQLLGHGSGSDPVLCEAVARHRRNEQAFRFKSSEELQQVERERHRLEKERREMDEDEKYFYDFQDLQAIYDFDHRHARSIKAAGIFRQGLQWTEAELEHFEETKIIREKVRLEKEGLPEALIKDFDPLSMIQEPPPTFRADDERRRAQYDQMIFSIGRLHNFSKRIHAFKMTRFELLSEREMYSIVLVALHRESYVFETQLSEIEQDLDKTSKLMSTFKAMQEMWLSANRIQAQALKDKLKAEMNRCGVWEAVNERHDITNIIKDETRTLLKSKLLMDAKLDNQTKAVQYRQTHYDTCLTKYEANEKYLTCLKYCTPGNLVYTRYGQCYISYYRQTDDMVMVTLPFGRPPAKAYIHYKEIINFERAKQKAEMLLMEQEDISMSQMITAERIKCKKERYLMAKEEEGLRKYFEFLDLGKNETQTMLTSITDAVNERFDVTESKIFNKMLKSQVNETVNKERETRKAVSKNYKGPPSGKPKPMGYFESLTRKRDVALEMKQAFILKGANQAEAHATRTLGETRSAWVLTYAFQQMIDSVIDGMIYEIASEAYSEGRVAKGFAEKKSGLMIPLPSHMQYATYNSLATIWRARKDELRDRIERNKGESSKLLALDPEKPKKEIKTDPEEVKRIKEARRLAKLEKKRQETLCKEMQQEEIQARNFYRWELLENLRERRRMREEERLSISMRKDEEKARLEAESAYSVTGAKGGNALSGTSTTKKDLTYDKRRQELKELTLERRRRVEEQAFMTLEDKAGQALRELDKLERQKKAYIAEFGEDEDEDDGMMGLNQLDLMSSTKSVVPDWLNVPPEFKVWDVQKQNKFIRLMSVVRMKTQRIEKNVQKEFRKLERLEAKSFKEWDNRFKVVEQAEMMSELELMEADEEKREAEAKLLDLKENMMRVLIYCREKGEEELHSRSELKRLQEIARRRDRELEEATAWLNLCIKRAKNRDKLKRRVVTDCKWVDTDTINGFHQRFATERLREKLYYTYFRMIVSSIINRAEVIATERNLMNLQEQLSFNKSKLVDRTTAMKNLLIEIRRDERMRMRRSFLNERFFPKARRRVLEQRFGGWVRYYLWNRGHKEAFQLKYEVIKRQLEIDRQFREQLKREEAEKKAAEKAANQPFQTLMQKHRERVIQCKSCLKCYLETQNTSISCQYHPKQFIMECPRSCPNPGLTNLCAAHKKRRWTCCDAVRVDATGCSRRYHLPPDSDPVYDKIMEKINERDRDYLLALDEKWNEAMKQDWPAKANKAKRQQVFDMEDQLAKDRKTAERIKDLKFV